MKKLLSMALALIMLTLPANANAEYLYTKKTTENVSGGITYEQRNILADTGWIRAYIAYIDISNPNTAIKVLTSSEGSSYLSTVQEMAYNHNTSIAINADFFNFSSGQTNMLGMVYQNGELISTPALDNQASFILTESNDVIMDYFSFNASVTSPQGYSCPIYQINKIPVDTGAITMLTDKWASKTWGAKNMAELVVENNIVTHIRKPGEGAIEMPKNGYILVVNPEINGFLDNFSIGDEVITNISLTPDITGITEATGGNTLIVNDGKTAKFTGNVTGYAQRTSVGVTKDGKTLILAATDGRQTDCKGLTQEGMAELMISLGAYKAINLDGGGSTTFVKKSPDGTQKTQNSVSSLRKVSTAIGVVSNNLSGAIATSGTLTSNSNTVFIGDTIKLQATFYDEYGNEMNLSSSQIVYSDSDGNILENGVFSPSYAGNHSVYAQYGEIIVSLNIEAVDEIFSLRILSDDFDISAGDKTTLSLCGYTINGSSFPISSHLARWSSSSPAITAENGLVTAYENKSAQITAELNGISDSVAINKSIDGIKASLSVHQEDTMYGNSDFGEKIAVSGHIPKGSTLFNIYFSHRRLENLKPYSHAYLMDNYYTDVNPQNSSSVSSFATRTYGSTSFISFDCTSGSVTPEIYKSLRNISNSSQKNVVLITKKPLSELGIDGEMLKSLLETCVSQGKNAFSVSEGSETSINFENGVRYLTAGTVSDYRVATYETDADYCPYIVFCVNGNEITYEFIKDTE